MAEPSPDGGRDRLRLRRHVGLGANRRLIADATGLFGTTVVTAGLGAVYWVLAARLLPANAVGLGGAAISAMTLIARVGTVGLGTLLLAELPVQPESARRLVTSSLAIAGGISAMLAVAFSLASAWFTSTPNASGPIAAVFLALGAAAMAAGFVLDSAFIGLQRGSLQFAPECGHARS